MTHASASTLEAPARAGGLVPFFSLACVLTWLFALPAAWAWMQRLPPSPFAITCAGLSAFGPLFATLLVASRTERREAFGRFRTAPGWVLLALLAPAAMHVTAVALYALFGGEVKTWFHPPATSEAWAALIVFPLGEEFGWRGFAYPKITRRYGLVRGSVLLGAVWGLWHLAYAITPERAGFDALEFGGTLMHLSLISVIISWVMERSNRSMATALAFHAGAHLDHLERAGDFHLGLRLCHLLVLGAVAVLAGRSLARATMTREARSC